MNSSSCLHEDCTNMMVPQIQTISKIAGQMSFLFPPTPPKKTKTHTHTHNNLLEIGKNCIWALASSDCDGMISGSLSKSCTQFNNNSFTGFVFQNSLTQALNFQILPESTQTWIIQALNCDQWRSQKNLGVVSKNNNTCYKTRQYSLIEI